jgi:hypothetical protein
VHLHGYSWTGEKALFDRESLRRPVGPPPPCGVAREVTDRYRSAMTEFPVSEVPPIETALWLMKPAALIRGTWQEARDAGTWLEARLAEAAPRYASGPERDAARRLGLVRAAVERLSQGGDVSFGHYLNGTAFHSLAVVTCSPNRSAPALHCPAR